MKNNIRSLILACALFWGAHAAFAHSNQSVDVFNQTICRGFSVNLNGTLYKLNGGYKVTSVTADNLPGKELVNEPRVTPQQTTVYTIKSATLAGAAQPDANVTVTVHNRPTLSIEFVNESTVVSDGMVCEGAGLQFRVKASGNLNGNPVTWYVSSLEQPVSGNQLNFTAERTCEVTALANNGYCPITDTTIRVRVFTPPTPGDVDVVWNTELKGTFCQSCGFFPDLRDILKSGDDEVVYANSTIEWADGGGTNEKTLSAGGNVLKVRIHYEVRRHNRCGDVSMQYDTVVDLRLSGVKDCKPEISSSYVTVRPCESARITLTNRYAGTLQLNGNGAVAPTMEDLSASPVAGEWSVTRTGPISQTGNELYNWEVLLQKYTAPKAWAGFKVSGTAKLSCPYSKTETVKTVNYSMNVSVRLD
ncbi:MAG: hypothetical protein K2M74_01180, partial [Bacteroidales bacterium]|nr:hypothetical protein [Bacteroidales bacterium]